MTPSRLCPFLMWSPYSTVDFLVAFFGDTVMLSRKIDPSRFFLWPPLSLLGHHHVIWGVEGCGDRPAVDFTVDFRLRMCLRVKDKKSTKYRSISVRPLTHQAKFITRPSNLKTHMKKYHTHSSRMPHRRTRQQQQLRQRLKPLEMRLEKPLKKRKKLFSSRKPCPQQALLLLHHHRGTLIEELLLEEE